MEDFQSHLNALGIATQVLMTGYVSDDELIWLYRNRYANLYPSLFEGFGRASEGPTLVGPVDVGPTSVGLVDVGPTSVGQVD
jgi:glycosyltransferase involved in cell wall biosynthesis